MDVGYDHLLMRSRVQQRFICASAIFLVATGAILLSAGIAYFVYAQKARSDLDKLNVSITQTAPQASDLDVAAASGAVAGQQGGGDIAAPLATDDIGDILGDLVKSQSEVPPLSTRVEDAPLVNPDIQLPDPAGSEGPAPQISPLAIAEQQPYPGEAIRATYWSDPLRYEPSSYVEAYLIQGFKPVDQANLPLRGTLPSPTQITVPTIGVDSQVAGLRIVDLGDSRAYETPKHVVGHIPQSANPGEKGHAWFFGHLESPIAREGNVFYDLPKIPDKLRKGEEVYVVVESEGGSYLYRITEAFAVHQDDLTMDYEALRELKPEYAQLGPGGANIHLVACVPRLVYDHRLVVSGELVGTR